MLKIKIFPACYGDYFLISIKEKGENINILVDGGLAKAYKDSLKIELKKLANNNQKIDLLINTHVDAYNSINVN